MDHVLTTGGRTYRLPAGNADVDALLEWLCTDRGRPEPLVAISRQQVLARLGRTTLPADFPDADVVIGDASRAAGFTRGWLESTLAAWEEAQLGAADSGNAESGPAPAAEAQPSDGGRGDSEVWPVKSRQWSDVAMTADGRIALITSHGVIAPSGTVLAGPMPNGAALGALLRWRWPRKPKDLPQLWLTFEALEAIGFPTAIDKGADGVVDLDELVASAFDCEVTWRQSGWFTCRFAGGDGERRTAHVVLIPMLYLDPPAQRPCDMGVAGWEGTATELPEDEIAAVKLLADRIAWLAGLADGVAPASRWATVGAQLLDAVRRRGRAKPIEACPLPVQVAVEAGELEPIVPPKWDNRPHKARGDKVDVEVDQRAAHLASAAQVELGYGTPKELKRINTAVFNEQRPPFGLWRLSTPAGADLDGLTKRLPLPHPAMQWDSPATFWITTRGIQHLTAPVELGGAGLSVAELEIDAAWVWPQQGRLLRTWGDVLRAKLIEARDAERQDLQDFIKGIYTTYLGRMSTDKWAPSQRQHQQPAWYAAIRADTRFRAMRYARVIADTHGLYPVAAELDAWIYRLPADVDPAILNEESPSNGKYRVKWVSAEAWPAGGGDGAGQ
jgi:hypothetical protein